LGRGRGWTLAKHVQVGDRLHGIAGVALVDAIAEVAPLEAYNLLVSGHHNYFVGDAGLLVHDNSPLEETTLIVPGLATVQPLP
jgi:hypothetical protein